MSRKLFAVLALVLALPVATHAQQGDFSQVEIKTTRVAAGIYMMEGSGGNLGLVTGADGALLIDDQFAPLTEKIKAAIAKVSDRPVRFLLNTHFHGDHTGGNENFGKAGVTIVAHDNVLTRLSTEQVSKIFNRTTPPSPRDALPVVTFNDSLTFHLDGQTIRVFHVAAAHTDGDAVVHFPQANVIHTGDVFFNGIYPVIDASAGGSIDGMIAADDRILSVSDGRTRIIPGHGPLGDKASLQAFRDMLAGVRDRIRPLMAAGKTEDEIVAARPTAAFDEKWGKGFMTPERFVRAVVWGMRAK